MGYKARKAKEQDELPDLKCKDVAMATVKIQGAYKGFKARKAAKAAQNGTPSTTKSVSRPPPAHKFPKPAMSAPVSRPPPAHKFPKPAKPAPPAVLQGQPSSISKRPMANRPMFSKVDERDTGRNASTQKKKKFQPGLKTEVEKPSQELLRHPGDVVAAAITIQRFMRTIKKNNELRKAEVKRKEKRERKLRQRKDTESSSAESATEEEDTKDDDITKSRDDITKDDDTETDSSEDSESEVSATTASDSSRTESKSGSSPSRSKSVSPSLSASSISKDSQPSTRKRRASSSYSGSVISVKEDMPDLKSKDVAAAALKIQSVYRGFQTRKVAKTVTSTTKKLKEVLQPVPSKGAVPKPKKEICPMCKQTVPGSLPGRAKSHCEDSGSSTDEDTNPDLDDPDVQEAAAKIQSAFKGMQAR